MLTISRFVTVEVGSLWHSLLFTRIIADSTTLEVMQASRELTLPLEMWNHRLGADAVTLLTQAGILVDPVADEQLLHNLSTRPVQIQGLYLLLSLNCNLDCSYCLYRASAGQSLATAHGKRQMSPRTAVQGVDCFSEAVLNNCHYEGYWQQVTFYGGEPLMNVAALTVAMKRVQQLQDEGALWSGTELVLNTNGTMLTDPFIRLLAAAGVEVQISIDGFADVHNRNRVTPAGEGSFDAVVKNLDRLQQAGASIHPMITVTDDNIPTLSEFAVWLCTTYGVRQYALNLLMSGTESIETDDYPERAAAAMLQTIRATEAIGATDPGLSSLVRGFDGPATVASQSCGGGRKITVFPSGEIHTCQALESSGISQVGELPDFDSDSPTVADWRARCRFQHKACLACPALGSCGGGCAAGSFHTSGTIHAIDPHSCRWTLALYALRDS